MHRIVVLALEGVIPFELSIASKVFGSATSADGEPLYEVLTCSVNGRIVTTDADYSIRVDHDADILRTADTVVIPASETLGLIQSHGILPPAVADALSLIGRKTRTVSICTAAYVLAAAGMLDGRRATTHWRQAAHFQELFPAVDVVPSILFVDDGQVMTSAGAAAGIDLCLQIVRKDHGSEVANRAARLCVVPAWRDGGQAQFVERPVPRDDGVTTREARLWAAEHLDSPISLQEFAEVARMSVRTFSRTFRREIGTSPSAWLTQQRVDRARELLESTSLQIEDVARRSGFGSAVVLRTHLRDAVGVAPSTYRRTFGQTVA
jgi:transcriptional regulator GlxA family with amidase domain